MAAAFRSKVMISTAAAFRSLITTTTSSSKNNNHLSSSSPLLCYHHRRRQFSSSLFTASSHDNKTVISIETAIWVENSPPFLGDIREPPSTTVETTPEEIIRFYKNMSIMRSRLLQIDAYKQQPPNKGGGSGGGILLDRQEEAVAVGLEAVLTKKDFILTTTPRHSNLYQKDENINVLREVEEGVHLQPPALGCTFMMWSSDDANQSSDDDDDDHHHLLFKLAAVLKLPAMLICEENNYGGILWGDCFVPRLKVDGMDVFAVKQACKFAKEYSLQNGPIVLKMDKCWYHGKSLFGARLGRDPIGRVRKLILSHGLATEKELEDYEKEIRKEVVHLKERIMPDPSEVSANVNVTGDGDEEQSSHNCQQNASNSGVGLS